MDGATQWLSDNVDADCSVLPFVPFTRRILRGAGWSCARIIDAQLYDEEQCVKSFGCAVSQWASNGCDRTQGRYWCTVRAAILHRLYPSVRDEGHRRVGGSGWWHAVSFLALPALVLLTET